MRVNKVFLCSTNKINLKCNIRRKYVNYPSYFSLYINNKSLSGKIFIYVKGNRKRKEKQEDSRNYFIHGKYHVYKIR